MDFPPLPRRRFLKACVGAGAAAGALGIGLPACADGKPGTTPFATAHGPLLVLDSARVAVLEAFAEASIATGDGFPAVRDTDLVRRLDEELYFSEPAIRDDVLLAIDAVDLFPVIYGRFARLHRLPLPRRRAFLEALADTRLDTVRAAVNGLRLLTSLFYYGQRGAWAAMGYEGTHAGLPPADTEQHAHYRTLTGTATPAPARGDA